MQTGRCWARPTVWTSVSAQVHGPGAMHHARPEIFLDTLMVYGGEVQDVTRLFERLGQDDSTGAIRNHFQGRTSGMGRTRSSRGSGRSPRFCPPPWRKKRSPRPEHCRPTRASCSTGVAPRA